MTRSRDKLTVNVDELSFTDFVPTPKKKRWKVERNDVKQFIAWDGEEARDAGYCLFGNSTGSRIKHPFLGTEEMLELIIETGRENPGAFHVIFSGYYDVNWWLKDIGKLRIAVLHKTGKVSWRGYTIEHIPHKIFTVSRADAETGKRIRVRIDDCFTFFRSRFDTALNKYNIGEEDIRAAITKGKDQRSDFWWDQIEEIEEYWEKELKYLVMLMNHIREIMVRVGINIGQWHGPGALASFALKKHGMGRFKKETPEEIIDAVLSAYSAGWFERFKAGYHDGPIYTADINSAYVYAISLLPNLAEGVWRHVDLPDRKDVVDTRFALYHIRFRGGFSHFMASTHGIPMPLPLRDEKGSISHPVSVDGWYWSPEASLVASSKEAEFVEAWIFDDDGTYPFRWVAEEYDKRLQLKREGNPGELIIKWMIASIYGRLAQRVGWDEKTLEAPKWNQMEWAGFITSYCRYMCYNAAESVAASDGLVSIDTDGVISTTPFDPDKLPNGIGDGLGEWKLEKFSGMIYVQNGVYWMKGMDGEWTDPKLRGVDKDALRRNRVTLGPDEVLAILAGDGIIRTKRKAFVGYGIALHTDWRRWRKWEELPLDIDVNNGGKRIHVPKLCRACRKGFGLTDCLHDLAPSIPGNEISVPHELPWRNPKRVNGWDIIKRYGTDDLDLEDGAAWRFRDIIGDDTGKTA